MLLGLVLLLAALATGEDDFEDVQSEFLLPYSVTEDVDFSIPRPGSFGCWQWLVLHFIIRIWVRLYYVTKPCDIRHMTV